MLSAAENRNLSASLPRPFGASVGRARAQLHAALACVWEAGSNMGCMDRYRHPLTRGPSSLYVAGKIQFTKHHNSAARAAASTRAIGPGARKVQEGSVVCTTYVPDASAA